MVLYKTHDLVSSSDNITPSHPKAFNDPSHLIGCEPLDGSVDLVEMTSPLYPSVISLIVELTPGKCAHLTKIVTLKWDGVTD